MKELTVKGLVTVEGMKFHEIEGGFGEDKKSMLVKEIAAIHGRELKDINKDINKNRKRFVDGIDVIDLKVGDFKSLSLELGYNKQSYANSNNIYVLSERGYAKLLKILDDDIAWEQYDKLVDGYFNMRKVIKEKTPDIMIAEAMQKLVENQNRHDEKIFKLIENQQKMTEKIGVITDQIKDITENYKMLCVITDGQWENKKKISSFNGGLQKISEIVEGTGITPADANKKLIEKGILYEDKIKGKVPTPESIEKGICEEVPVRANPGKYFAVYTTKGQKIVREILGVEEVEQTALDNVIEFKK